MILTPGQRVVVNFGEKRGWLPGTFQAYSSPSIDEDFRRCRVVMDNGLACHGDGYHPDCVRVQESEMFTLREQNGLLNNTTSTNNAKGMP